jgi:hypothetical protein
LDWGVRKDRGAMMITLSHLYSDDLTAGAVIGELRAAGLPEDDIGLIASTHRSKMRNADLENADDRIDRDRDGTDDRSEAVEKGAGVGAMLGGAAGLLAGLGLLALPGIGPVVAAGWLATAIGGAVAGGTTGGIVGALTEAGVSENDAPRYLEGVQRGGALVTVRVMAEDRPLYEEILERGGAPAPVPAHPAVVRPPDTETNPV